MTATGKCYPYLRVIVETWVNFKPCKGINLTTRHQRARRAPRVATVHNTVKESGRVLPCPSAIFHPYASVDTPWVAQILSHYTPVKRGKISSNSVTHKATMLTGPHKSCMRQYIMKLAHRGQRIDPLLTQVGATTFGALNWQQTSPRPSHLIFSTFPQLPHPVSY
jgi:hypothetical protein